VAAADLQQIAIERRAKVQEFQRSHRVAVLTLVFTDIVDSTKLKQALGDHHAVTAIQQHHAAIREILGRFGQGQEIETAGDSFFIVFTNPSDAVKFSLFTQARLRALAAETGRPIFDRIGIHVGEVLLEDDAGHGRAEALYGIQVDTCARVQSLAQGGQILLTRFAFEEARRSLSFDELNGVDPLSWLTHGPYLLKGVEEPIEICEVGELGKAKLRRPPDTEKARRFISAEPAQYWNVPVRNRLFTGREEVFEKLHGELERDGRAALSGLGGIGKTQTAIEYAHRCRSDYNAVFLIASDTKAALTAGLVEIADVLALPGRDARDQKETIGAVKRWLLEHERWLLIADNADDLALVKNMLPFDGPGKILLTTRAAGTGTLAEALMLKKMGPEEGAGFLLRRAGLLGRKSGREAVPDDQQAAARELSIKLDGLPLALDQAGAFIEETPSSPTEYLQLYAEAGAELRRIGKPEQESVHATFSLAFEKVGSASRAAADLLRLCAFFAPDQIPEEIFVKGAPELGENFGTLATNSLQRTQMIGQACRFSLLHRDTLSKTLSIHRQVQAVLRDMMVETGEERAWAERAVRAVNRAFPEAGFSTWAVCERLLPQAYACAELIKQWGFEFPEGARLLNQAGVYLKARGRYTDAKSLYERALAIREKALGPEHLDVAESLHNLASLYRTQCQYNTAEPLFKRALAICEKVDPEHSEVARNLNSLAALYRDKCQYAEAESLLERARAIWEKSLGPHSRQVAWSLHNMASLYRVQLQYDKAEPLYERARMILQKTLGPEHPDVAETLHRMAQLYDAQGQYAKAEPFYEEALAIWEKNLGPEHPDVAICLKNYALLLRTIGRSEEAMHLESRAI
jgi:class 3 adenylate cyclase/tetratricopeptide (TPR) repeat protein